MKRHYVKIFAGLIMTAGLLSGCENMEELYRLAETAVQENSVEPEKEEHEEAEAEEQEKISEEKSDGTEAEAVSTPVKIVLTEKSETFRDETDDTELLTVNYQEIALTCQTLKGMGAITEKLGRAQDDVIAQVTSPEEGDGEGAYLYAYAKEHYQMTKEEDDFPFLSPYYYGSSYTVHRGDPGIISLTKREETYMGGAHGSHYENVYNFDPDTGEKITLADLSEDREGFLTLCLDQIKGQADQMQKGEEGPVFFDDYEDYLVGILTDENFYLSKEGLVFISQEYMLQPYAAGIIEFTVPYEELQGSLKERFLPSEKMPDFEIITE